MGQAAKTKENDARVRARILKLLGWSEGHLLEQMDTLCLEWLNRVAGSQREVADGVPTVRRRLEGNAEFRAWWASQWASLDAMLDPCLKVQVEGQREPVLWYTNPTTQIMTGFWLEAWRVWYLERHDWYMVKLRPDNQVLRDILKS